MSEVLKGTHVFDVMNVEVIWTSGKRIAAVFSSLQNNIRRKAGSRIIKWKLPPDNPGERVAGIGDSGGELFSKSCCYFYVASK